MKYLQEGSLREAIALYEETIASLNHELAAADNLELTDLKSQLEQALQDAQACLSQQKEGRSVKRRRDGGSNRKIHPQSIHAQKAHDFGELARRYPSLAPYLTSAMSIDFADYGACRELTKVLLDEDFGVKHWWVPDGQLVPPLTNRANYISWLNDLLVNVSKFDGEVGVDGVDIGCGANLIYPLLGASLFNWAFVAVDVTDIAVECAAQILEHNEHLKPRISIQKVPLQPAQGGSEDEGGILTVALEHIRGTIQFTMCNPPFFEDISEASRNPATAFGGTEVEMVYPGGEEAFITAMVEDSLHWRDKVHWFSTMFGKKNTMKYTRRLLYSKGVKVMRSTEFVQGKTLRWGIAWSFVADPATNKKPLRPV